VLARHPRVDPQRVAALGFSTGGAAVLWAAQERFRSRYARGPSRFAAHVAFHPSSCQVRLDGEADVDAPLRILVGQDDDWTPAAPCLAWGARLRAAGRDAGVHVYAAARHAFTNVDLPPVQRVFGVVNRGGCAFRERDGTLVDFANRPAGEGDGCASPHATVGYDAGAHRRAEADVARFLSDVFR
jgi:dienelactone hydrolase